ncbi:hypothetical protein A2154_02760 [Candidatus Gottesmanbacteria bacterium RBG_16_43_7]|uniref:Membrane protein 6-pyruvoyl-tetrahydropterin synthase-related domain-containing protein n=1 Tax=Candidatus Gottesmanbacteria bacterium RBG_16_43_7 TaxID=1798373 RepID=A0A1F5Z7G8_9BACT|nr:MAG: hypothetical protein A2154_02760 [Candidatus Gottesmanbacteria bacterium RBG_16_43_7]
MNKKEVLIIAGIGLLITALFFYKTVFFGKIPFPGDLLVSSYQPFRSESYLGYVPGSIPHKAQYFDAIRQMYPWKNFTVGQLQSLKLPLWNPYNFSGTTHLANNQTAVFYPLNLIYLFLPIHIAWTILIILQPLLAFLFVYLYLRNLKISVLGSVLSSLSWGFSLYMSAFLEYNTIGHTILWLPLILFAADTYIQKQKPVYLIFVFAGLTSAGLAGHLQVFGTLLVFSIIYISITTKINAEKIQIKSLVPVLIVILLSITALSVQMLPTLELIKNSARSNYPESMFVNEFLMAPQQLIVTFAPDYFGNPVSRNYALTGSYPMRAIYAGMIPTILALLAVIGLWKKVKLIQFLSILAAIILFLTVRHPLSPFLYRLNLPFYTQSAPGNMFFLLVFFISVLSGFGFDWLNDYGHLKNKSSIWRSLPVPIIILILFISASQIHEPTKYILLPLGLMGFLAIFIIVKKFLSPQLVKIGLVILVLLTSADLFYYFSKFNPFTNSRLVFPETPIINEIIKKAGLNRIWGHGYAAIDANIHTYYRIFSPDGYDPLYPKWYGELIHASENGQLPDAFTVRTRSDANLAPSFGDGRLTDNPYRMRLINVMGVRYILDLAQSGSSEKTFPTAQFTLLSKIGPWTIYENTQALPRAYMAYDYQVYKNRREFADIFFRPGFNPQTTILLEKPPNLSLPKSGHGIVRIGKYEPNLISLEVKTDTDGLLFLSDTYYPGWMAAVDGKPAPILKAHYTFRAIPVNSGSHRVLLEYAPKNIYYGTIISTLSLICLLLYIFVSTKK